MLIGGLYYAVYRETQLDRAAHTHRGGSRTKFMKGVYWKSLALVFFVVSTCPAVRADEGMWLFNDPPSGLLKDKYKFDISPSWLDHLQKASVRFNDGGSGSFVSPDGLVMTNHHVGTDCIQKIGTKEHDYITGISVLAFRTEHGTPNRLRWCRPLGVFHPARFRWPAGKGLALPLPVRKKAARAHCKRFLRHLAVPASFLQPVFFPAASSYPVGRGNAQILRKIDPNTRRVRWLSANRSQ